MPLIPGIPAFPCDNQSHEAIASWFLGPKAENHEFMRIAFNFIVDDLRRARQDYKPDDGEFITAEVQSSPAFLNSMGKLKDLLVKLSGYMSEHNIPFFSPRYNAHMNSDTSLPGTLGYLLTMLYNPNNVAPEASPLTSLMEYEVGQDLCDMLGYTRQPVSGPRDSTMDPNSNPLAWGHITCDGSVANLESMWVARNLKFYPLSLKNAMAPGAPFAYIAPKLTVPLCTGETKLLNECTTWELLNLTADAILDLGPRITLEFGLSNDFVQKVMSDYIIQTTSKGPLEIQYGIDLSPQYFVATTKHYSWPKGTAITGIGSANLIEVHIDNHGRMKMEHLEGLLEGCLERKQAVYAVVAIIGSTEHGAVDPLSKVVELREKFQRRGLSFLVHADAAWGGYFASLLTNVPRKQRDGTVVLDPYIPRMTLLPYTKIQLEHLKDADTITIDPHKSGYIPYPAGALCYRDERMRFLVTWTSPYIDFQSEGVQTMGTYGLEGSKPGAAPVAAWLSHEVIGLHKGGYGALLGEAMFTGVKMYCHWATMDTPELVVAPFNMLPSEQKLHATQEDVEVEKQFIREHILNRPNRELVADKEAMELVQQLGSDLLINAFSCNFRIDGVTNTSVTEANILNSRIYETLSVLKVADNVAHRDIFVMSTVFSQAKYGECLTNFKRRLGLEGDEDLFALGNASMSPFPTAGNFVAELAEAFKTTALNIIEKTCIPRNVVTPCRHSFIMQGTDKVHLVYLPMFQMATFRQQLILAVDLSPDAMSVYAEAKRQNPQAVFCLHTSEDVLLSDILAQGSFQANIDDDIPENHAAITDPNGNHLLENITVSNIREIKHRSLDPRLLEPCYPERMPFYLYGTIQQQHIDHILLSSPNVQLSASDVTLTFDEDQDLYGPGLEKELELGLIAVFDDVHEAGMQPFTSSHQPNFFDHGKSFRVTIHRDSPKGVIAAINSSVFAKGTIKINDESSVFTDYEMLNQDPTRINDPNASISAEDLASVEDFVRGRTTASEILAHGNVQNVVAHGNCIVLDRFHRHNRHTDHTRTVAQRSAWKASWETAVGRAR